MSEAGFERAYQGSVILPLFPVALAGTPGTVEVTLALADL